MTMDSSPRGSTEQLSSTDSAGPSMHHSLSTPAGVDGSSRTPPATPKKGGKMLAIRVQMLDDAVTIFQVQAKALGSVLFEQVCKQLHLLEADYFGLEYADVGGTKYWLDLQKPISRQLGLSLVDPLLYFCVKFYTPDPAQLEEEYTRYLFCLQIKRDLAIGCLQCNENTAALMASYIVQAECGDFVAEDYPDHTYLSGYKFVPQQDMEMERKIMENHKKHAGQSPAEADLNLLETARRCELYGIKMHPAKDHENIPLNLAVAHMGIVVFQNYIKINTFSWAKIRKISFKRKRFLIKLHPEGYGYYRDTVDFFFEGRNECKNFWKKCVENHGFFRCSSVKHVPRHRTRVLSRGSSFRYSGKTQKQIVEFVRDNYVKRQTFQRSASFRHSSAHSSATNMHASTVGNSISAHPLLPLADSTISAEASKLSTSLSSMPGLGGVKAAGVPGSPTTRSAYHPRGRATCWSSAPDALPTAQQPLTTTSPTRTQNHSPSPPGVSVITSPLEGSPSAPLPPPPEIPRPPAAAVHRADVQHHRDQGTSTRLITATGRTPSSRHSEGRLDRSSPPFVNACPSQTQSQTDLGLKYSASGRHSPCQAPPQRRIWQRSSSCRELSDYSFEDSGEAKRRPEPHSSIARIEHNKFSLDERQLDSPVTRYDDHRALYSSTSRDDSLEIHQDIMMPDQKVYAGNYPGLMLYSQESVEDPGNYDLRDSQDDLSHDSYELLEKSDDDFSSSGDYLYHKTKPPLNVRSCSLDSGNYLPSDTDSDNERRHKCKSSIDVHHELFMEEDPRDLPREIVPRKSDGNFYKSFKMTSRTSSLESKSDYYESKNSKFSKESLKRKGYGSRTSSQESRSDSESRRVKKNKSSENLSKRSEYFDSRTSSCESKSEYYDTTSKLIEELKCMNHSHNFDRKIDFERNYGTQRSKLDDKISEMSEINQNNCTQYNGFSDFKETSHVHSISLQNVETDRTSRKLNNYEQNTLPRTQKSSHHLVTQNSLEKEPYKSTHIWPHGIPGVPTEIREWSKQPTDKSTESESNIFSFDEDRIKSLEESSDADNFSVVPSIDNEISEPKKRDSFRSKFMEIEIRKCREPLPLHQPIERTKSDPNSLARQRLNSSSRRLLLMHQKSIDLTPAESSDEDYLYKQIPSAPPITKYKGTHFEMPTAEFGHFDILKREIEGQKTKFEVPKSQFEMLGAKNQTDLINLPPKSEDIPYVLHKRHVMNGTAAIEIKTSETESDAQEPPYLDVEAKLTSDELVGKSKDTDSGFLFTQNIDLSKVDPVTLEVDKSQLPVHIVSPKRDITHVDPILFEALNHKLSQIESDSPTSSKTESLHPKVQILMTSQKDKQICKPEIKQKVSQAVQISEPDGKEKFKIDPKIKLKEKGKLDLKAKRVIKPRMQPGKKGIKTTKTKVRITSFSSDDESLDSDDVFGSAEATPTRIEFSPPQTRKEMESILKFESERKYLQYTMSSTEVEGSPPQTRKKPDKKQMEEIEIQTELRRISERSFSIPSSEDDVNVKTSDILQTAEAETDASKAKDNDKDDETLKEEVTVKERNDLMMIAEERDYDKEREVEKMLLQAEIENDIKNLKVPPKTKITDLTSPSTRKRGQLFAHARLNLSEGSALTLLQKQQASESPASGRRAISLDAPIISVNRLPPLNAFSSKDDTVEETDIEINKYSSNVSISSTAEESIGDKSKKSDTSEGKLENILVEDSKKIENLEEAKPPLMPKAKDIERDQIVPDVSAKNRKAKIITHAKGYHAQKTFKTKSSLHSNDRIDKEKSSQKLKPGAKVASSSSPGVTISKKIGKETKIEPVTLEKSKLHESTTSHKEPPMLAVPEIKRTKSQEIESHKHVIPKEKAKSLDKLELKRSGSKERSKSQEESDPDIIAKRKEKQQMLYEIAIKQTKTLKSPVKDVLPVFPQVEEMVRERHGKLEISINTIENPAVSLEDAIIITKSPKKLDKKIDKKLTKSLELNLSVDDGAKISRLGSSLDLDNRPVNKSEEYQEFDFKQESITSYHKILAENDAMKLDQHAEDNIVLEGTSLDVWLSVDRQKDSSSEVHDKLDDIKVIKKSDSFFDQRLSSKPPDLGKEETKNSSDPQSLEKLSSGNSLEMKYIDNSDNSSHKSDQEALLVAQMKRGTDIMRKHLRRKLENRQKETDCIDEGLVRITSEDESLVEVEGNEKYEEESNLDLLGADIKKSLSKLSSERSRSEDTGSWMTVDCEEFVGAETSLDIENEPLDSPEKESENPPEKDGEEKISAYDECKKNIPASADIKQELKFLEVKLVESEVKGSIHHNKIDLLKISSDHSKSSDTTGSWTSGEKELSPVNVKETDESSASSMGRAIGLSQTIETFGPRDLHDRSPSEHDQPRSPRSPRICVLGRAFTIDEESISQDCEEKERLSEISSDEAQDIPKDDVNGKDNMKDNGSLKKNGQDMKEPYQKRIPRSLLPDKSLSSVEDVLTDRKKNGYDSIQKPSLSSIEKLSTESKNSVDTESSSGSFGIAIRMQKSGEIAKELSSTWKPFPLDSSGSESFDDGLLPPDQDVERHEYFLCCEGSELSKIDSVAQRDDTDLPEDLAHFSSSFGYPGIDMTGLQINLNSLEVQNYGPAYLSRTLSRISERSTNSEKSSLEEDNTKASTQSDSLNDESMASSNPQVSLSSDPPSNAHFSDNGKKMSNNGISVNNGRLSFNGKNKHLIDRRSESSSSKPDRHSDHRPNFDQLPTISSLLQRQISDDRRTSAEMAELSMDDIEIITSERGLKLKRQGSDDTIIDEECFEPEYKGEPRGSSSQESEEWPLPEIPQPAQKSLIAMHEVPSSDTSQQTTQVFQPPKTNIPKTFGLRGSLRSQDSEQWPSPPSSVVEPPLVGNVETFYVNAPEEPCREIVDSNTSNTTNTTNTTSNENESNSDSENRTLEVDTDKTHTYENVPTEHISESISESLSVGASGVKIVVDSKSSYLRDSNSDEDLNLSNSNLNDDVFTDTVGESTKNELRPPTALRKSTTSDDSSHSGKHTDGKLSIKKGSPSSHSDEDGTSSMITHFEDGTVRHALNPTKCTHSSHSEDTSVALSLSEWSNSTNTVKFQNLSSNSGTTKSSSGLKSEDNSLTDIAISEWSSSNSNTLKQQSTSLQFQKLSSTTTSTGDSTLTDLMPTISEWSSSDSKTLVPSQQLYPGSLPDRPSISRLGSSIDEGDLEVTLEKKGVPSPKNIPSEDLALLSTSLPIKTDKLFTKSTERPIVIPVQTLSDTEKSSSSIEHKTVHTQRYDKQKYLQRQPSSTSDKSKHPLKFSKCSPYYSSSLSSESTPLASSSPIPMNKTATVPLTRSHRKPVTKSLFHAKSPPSENDSTSSVESPKSKSDRDRRGYRRRRQSQTQRRQKIEKEAQPVDEYYYVESETGLTEYNEYLHSKNMEGIVSGFMYECSMPEDASVHYRETLEEGYYPDGDSQSGSDIFRMEKDDDGYEVGEGFDVSCIPPPLLEDDLEDMPQS